MEPKGLLQRKKQLLRVYEDGGDNLYTFYRNRYPEKNDEHILQWVDDAAKNREWAYYDAGVLPEVVIKPPKDNAVYKANYMIPNKELRNQFYNSINNNSGYFNDYTKDTRTYINKLWDLYKKSGKPTIKPVSSRISPEMTVLQKIGVMNGDETRATYDPYFNTMFVNPEDAADDIVAEMAHAYQFHGTDTPRSFNWVKQFFSLPGDIEINNKSGYDRHGNKEYIAHSIIEPRFNMYLTGNYPYDFIWNSIQNEYNKPEQQIKRNSYINTTIP